MRGLLLILFLLVFQLEVRSQKVFKFESFKETVLLIYEGDIDKPNSISNGILVKDQKTYYGCINYSAGIFIVSKKMNSKLKKMVLNLTFDTIEKLFEKRLEDFRVIENRIPYSIVKFSPSKENHLPLYSGSDTKIYSKEYRKLLMDLNSLFSKKKKFIIKEP